VWCAVFLFGLRASPPPPSGRSHLAMVIPLRLGSRPFLYCFLFSAPPPVAAPNTRSSPAQPARHGPGTRAPGPRHSNQPSQPSVRSRPVVPRSLVKVLWARVSPGFLRRLSLQPTYIRTSPEPCQGKTKECLYIRERPVRVTNK
jgi:hypothetical protein